jgi:hypothetical protein
VAFVDLVKAYDMADHDLLLKVFEKYGAPPKFVAAIKTMYTDLRVVLKNDKEIQEIPQIVGIWQGNNMAPVLFLFLMSVAAEMLKSAWKQAGIEVLTVAHTPDDKLDTDYVQGHTPHMYTYANSLPMRSTNSSLSTMALSPSPHMLPWSKDSPLCIATLHVLASKYILDKIVTPPKLNAYSFPLPNSLIIYSILCSSANWWCWWTLPALPRSKFWHTLSL